MGTPRQLSNAMRIVREDYAPEISRTGQCAVDDRRWQWTAYANLVEWFDGWKAFLLFHGFASDAPETQPDGRVPEVTLSPDKARRIGNARRRGATRRTMRWALRAIAVGHA